MAYASWDVSNEALEGRAKELAVKIHDAVDKHDTGCAAMYRKELRKWRSMHTIPSQFDRVCDEAYREAKLLSFEPYL